MKTTNNTILITGGSAGIGFAIAERFHSNNKVIIVGRNEQRLKAASSRLTNVTAIAADVSDPADVERLAGILRRDHPDLNILINNAGKAFAFDLTAEDAGGFEKAEQEMLTNYLSVVRLNELLLPLLRVQPQAAIVNVSSIVAFVPGVRIATYSATKAALHSYTQSLRHLLSGSSVVRVFDLMPPLVNTEFSAGIGGHKGIAPSVVADALATALEKDDYEIRVGDTEKVYQLSRSNPEEAFQAMNPITEPV
ncbi:MAG TPA: SDR family NAD(P)-dependent oxidoreductase [Puia sp.]|jgi:uncharacterized oxidoreductase|nr:SDR family NAD(P)-dependent oxidoreductase [Puia sp.]